MRGLDPIMGVMGYHRPVSAWNPGKQAEHAERTPFVEPAGFGYPDQMVQNQ